MKIKIIQLFCLFILLSCQNNNIKVFDGSDTSLSKLNGNWIVINYWADWCAPCIKEIPELNEFAKENEDLFVYTFNFDHLEIEDLSSANYTAISFTMGLDTIKNKIQSKPSRNTDIR